MQHQIKIFSKIEPELKEHWLELEKNSSSFCFQSYEWFENWFNHYRKNNEKFKLNIAVILSKNKVCCIFPLEINSYSKIKILQWAGNKVTDYNAPILNKNFDLDKNKFNDLWNEIINLVPNLDLIYLKQQPLCIEKIYNPFVSFLKNYKDSRVYHISLPKTWSEYTSKFLKKKFLNDNLRTKKQLKKLGNLKYKVEKNQNEKIRYIDEIINQKNTKLIKQKSDNIFSELDKKFYTDFEKKNLENIRTHIGTIFLNNEKIA